MIISDVSTSPTNETDDGCLELRGGFGYQNGADILNELCAKCYKNTSYEGIKVRSLNLSDIEGVINKEKFDVEKYIQKKINEDSNGEGTKYTINEGWTKQMIEQEYKNPIYYELLHNIKCLNLDYYLASKNSSTLTFSGGTWNDYAIQLISGTNIESDTLYYEEFHKTEINTVSHAIRPVVIIPMKSCKLDLSKDGTVNYEFTIEPIGNDSEIIEEEQQPNEEINNIEEDKRENTQLKETEKPTTTITDKQEAKAINEKEVVGSFIKYDVPYTDIYTNKEYTSVNGWQILSIKKNNSKYDIEIVSTARPLGLNYNYSTIKSATWAGNESQRTKYITEVGSFSRQKDDYNVYAASGLYYNFEKIPFNTSDKDKASDNYGYFTKINGKVPSNQITGNVLRATNGISNKIKGVRSVCTKDAIKYNSSIGWGLWWNATPSYKNDRDLTIDVQGQVEELREGQCGLRIVISLEQVELTKNSDTGILEMK